MSLASMLFLLFAGTLSAMFNVYRSKQSEFNAPEWVLIDIGLPMLVVAFFYWWNA